MVSEPKLPPIPPNKDVKVYALKYVDIIVSPLLGLP